MKKLLRKKLYGIVSIRSIIYVILTVTALFCVAFIHFDKETSKNTYTVTTTISDVQYKEFARTYWVTFSTPYGDYYYKFYKTRNVMKKQETLVYIENSKKEVQLTITKEKEFWRLLAFDNRLHVIDIRDDNQVYFSIEEHNRDQKFDNIFCCVIASLIILVFISYCYIMKKLK